MRKIALLNQHPRDPSGERSKTDPDLIRERVAQYVDDDTEIDPIFPDDFPGSRVIYKLGDAKAYNGLHHVMETRSLVRKAKWAEEEGYDAVVQSSTFEPGVEESRLAVEIPVVGLFRPTLTVALDLASRVGLVVPLPGHVNVIERRLRNYGLGGFVSRIESLDAYGSLEHIREHADEIADAIVAQIERMVDDHRVECVIPLGGLVVPWVVSPSDLEAAVDVPVLNTNAIGFRMAEMYVDLGIRPSPRAYSPPEFLTHEDFLTYEYDR